MRSLVPLVQRFELWQAVGVLAVAHGVRLGNMTESLSGKSRKEIGDSADLEIDQAVCSCLSHDHEVTAS